jgi:hypothetical protein
MNDKPRDVCTRRDLLRGLARGAAIAALAGGAVALGLRRRDASDAAHVCTNEGVCRGCGRAEGCILPAAESFRRFQARR